jgi:hypothetical protein
MRPAQGICEQCHWPKKYVGNEDRTFQHYLSDEKNTPFAVRLLLNVAVAILRTGRWAEFIGT